MNDDELQNLKDQRATLNSSIDEMRSAYNAANDPALLKRMDDTKASVGRIDRQIATGMAVRMDHIKELAKDPANLLSTNAAPADVRTSRPGPFGKENSRDAGLRAVELRSDVLDSRSGDRLVGLIERDKGGADGEYIAAIADPDYEAAFGRLIESPHPILTDKEARAVQRATHAMRSLNISTPSAGGYAIPLSLDPTIILTSSGVVNPLRSLATVSTISTSEWAGISSAGVTASFVAEGTEATDNSPTLAQPKIKPQKAHATIKYTHEAGEDWANLQGEMGKLFEDAKSTVEAEKFALGSGSGEPAGIVTGATETVTSATAATLANADVYALQAALPSRWQPGATWLSNLPIANGIYVKSGPGSTEPALFTEDRTKLLAKPWHELSTMSSALTANAIPLIYGDIGAGFRIVDRVGASVELIPNLFGTNGLPNGYRAMYMHWRTGSAVVNAKAIRALKMHT